MIINKIMPNMTSIIGLAQTNFVPGRHVTESIIITQLVIHSMRHKREATSLIAIKDDLEKSYDRIKCNF